jgi:hypothetical protein
MKNITLAKLFEDPLTILTCNGKDLAKMDEGYYLVTAHLGDDATPEDIDVVLEHPYYVGNSLQKALNELGKE